MSKPTVEENVEKNSDTPTRSPNGGAPKANLNSTRNGSRLARLPLGELPRPMYRLTRHLREYRRDLEELVVSEHGEVSVVMAHEIDSACGFQQHQSICRWLLHNRLDRMTESDIIKASSAIANAKAQRNAVVRRLGIDPTEADGGGNGNWPPFIVARECEPPTPPCEPPTEPPQPPQQPSSRSDDTSAGDGDSGESGDDGDAEGDGSDAED